MSQVAAEDLPLVGRVARINWRLTAFVGVLALVFGSILWVYVSSRLSRGITAEGEYKRVEFIQMVTFEMDQRAGKVTDIPEVYRALDGQRVILVGEMVPGGFEARGADQFCQVVYSVQKCCVTSEPKIQHFVQTTIPPEVMRTLSSDVAVGQIEVRGVLSVKLTPEDRQPGDKIEGVFHLRVESMKRVG